MTAPVSTQAVTSIVTPYSGDYRIDVLLPSATARWNNGSPVGTAVTLSYSFMNSAPLYGSSTDQAGFTVFNEAQKTATRQILASISQQVGITFNEVSDSAWSYGTLRFGNNAQGTVSAGYASYPDTASPDSAGDMYINNQIAENLTNIIPGTNSWATLVHEIGHTLGLKHPGNYNAGESASTIPDNFLASSEDNEGTTIMSYIKVTQNQERIFFGKYDLLALKYLYGGVAYNNTDTSYTYDNAAGQNLLLINDSGGSDTIDLSAIVLGATIDLTAGASSSVGVLADGLTAAINNLSLAYDATIENVIGTALGDTLTGNSSNNMFTGGVGSDVINGGGGVDTAVFSGSRTSYTLIRTGNGFSVEAPNAEGSDALSNVERLQFSNARLALDLDGSAGTTVKILGAVFGASSVSNTAYLGIGLGYLDGGMSYQDLMMLALNAKLGAGFSNAAEVSLIYQNLVGTPPSTADLNYWTGTLSSGQYSQASLAVMAADLDLNKTNIGFIGLQGTGVEYS